MSDGSEFTCPGIQDIHIPLTGGNPTSTSSKDSATRVDRVTGIEAANGHYCADSRLQRRRLERPHTPIDCDLFFSSYHDG